MKDQGAYLGHIIDAIQDIQLYASVGRGCRWLSNDAELISGHEG